MSITTIAPLNSVLNSPSIRIRDLLTVYFEDRSAVVADFGYRMAGDIRQINKIIGNIPITSITQTTIDTYVAKRVNDGVLPQTARKELSRLVAALNWTDHGTKHLHLPLNGLPRVRIISQDEINRLVAAAKQDNLRIFMLIALATGARRTAICELTWNRIDFDQNTIDFRAPHLRHNRRKGRIVAPMSHKLREILLKHRAEHSHPYLIDIKPHSINKAFRAARKRAGLSDDVTPHVLRHTAATHMIRSIPIFQASKMLGHASVKTTESTYIHLAARDLQCAADSLAELI